MLCAPCSLNLSHIDWWRACPPAAGAPFGRVQCSECNDVLMSVAGRDEPPFDACAKRRRLRRCRRPHRGT
ncbi:MAG: hypothetical protein ACLR3C_05185 [Eggerthella lenta]